MTTVVFKYEIFPPVLNDGRTTLILPCDYRILSAGFMHNGKDAGKMCVWVQHTKELQSKPIKKVYIEVYGTGEEVQFPETLCFIDTVHIDPFSTFPEIYHVYQRCG